MAFADPFLDIYISYDLFFRYKLAASQAAAAVRAARAPGRDDSMAESTQGSGAITEVIGGRDRHRLRDFSACNLLPAA